jgi:hypothetical protein
MPGDDSRERGGALQGFDHRGVEQKITRGGGITKNTPEVILFGAPNLWIRALLASVAFWTNSIAIGRRCRS